MRKLLFFLFAQSIISYSAAFCQAIDSLKFFTDEPVIDITLSTDIRQLQKEHKEDVFQEANIKLLFDDGTTIEEKIQVGARGKFRRSFCRIPPLMLNFRNTTSPRLHTLGKLKLVMGCGVRTEDEELLLKEFLVYKIYNLLEQKSFRVRLARVTYNDTRNKIKPFTQYAFLIEDDADMARRNGCRKKDHGQYLTESTNRELMTKVALFQYMIGNTDWAIPNGHNVKLIFDRKDDNALPFVVPYDFDYCGLVNARYAVPHEIFGTQKVTERIYRGFPRTMEELQFTLNIFRDQQQNIYSLINTFNPLDEKIRKGMVEYLDEFYKMIDNQGKVKTIFIDNARTQ